MRLLFIYLFSVLADAAGRLAHSNANTRLTKEETVETFQSDTKTFFLQLFILENCMPPPVSLVYDAETM